MAHDSASASAAPRELLTSVRDLARQVRIAQRGTWFPLLVFAVITLGSIPLSRYGPRHLTACVTAPAQGGQGGQAAMVCGVVRPWAAVYWPVALVVAYAAIATFYLRRSRRRGVGTRIRPYVVAGIAFAVLVSAASLWVTYHPAISRQGVTPLVEIGYRAQSPLAAIGVALLVLAWVERHRLLAWFSLAYLLVVLVPQDILPRQPHVAVGHYVAGDTPQHLLMIAGLLLAGSAGFALYGYRAQRRAR
jgi:hypothetical protein